jgi:hypothetical protein
VIRVAANIAYEDAQRAIDGSGGVEAELVDTALKPLWDCWTALYKARQKREPLELDLPERAVVLDEKGRITSVAPRERLDAHKLVEDYMIAANVAAAKALEAKKAPVMYRVHEPPTREKLTALKDYLATFDLEFALGQVIRPATFNRIIERVGESDARPEIMEQLLRTQTQARYEPGHLGHFGLSLGSYAHFTSPIRRYADLLVHRSLVSAYGLGEGGLPAEDANAFEEIGQHISMLERRAMEAERETIDRYVAAYLADHVGTLLDCRISGVQPFGIFATVEGLGGDGLIPAGDLGREYFRYDEAAKQLIGDESGEAYRVGQRLQLRLIEANPVSGALRFELPEGSYGRPAGGPRNSGVTASVVQLSAGVAVRQTSATKAARNRKQLHAKTIAVLRGSPRAGSLTEKLARAIELAAGDRLAFHDVPVHDLPLYNPDLEKDAAHPDWDAFREAVKSCDGLLFVTPNGTARSRAGSRMPSISARALMGRACSPAGRPESSRSRPVPPAASAATMRSPEPRPPRCHRPGPTRDVCRQSFGRPVLRGWPVSDKRLAKLIDGFADTSSHG